ncbi:hypothetical protein [Domibacillus aminovorans]|uniref:Uncharacterized protein n=1 Tax=Domibacillus aminovorans TaxID=29332 RepID=A0A177L0L5_9BACI|nr:hypothetical protein [Domibacillus aminovorans]OAH59179.1 hypothetical protein AWH49_18710 [Domibacillus aminovorans]
MTGVRSLIIQGMALSLVCKKGIKCNVLNHFYQIDQETKKETEIYIPVTFEKMENRVDVYLLLCDNTDVHKVLFDSKMEQQIHRLKRGKEAYITLKKAECELSKKVVEWNSTRTTLSTYQSRRRTASKFLKGVTADEIIRH